MIGVRGRWFYAALAAAYVILIAECIVLVWLLRQDSVRSDQGQMARMTQCAREPVFRKLVVAGRHYGLLNRGDVAVFMRTSPQGCPPRP